MPKRPRKRDLTFYLIKEDHRDFAAVVTEVDGVEKHEVGATQGVPYEGALFVRAPRQRPPWWLEFLKQGVPNLGTLLNANTAAALILWADNRMFAVTFGYGRNLLALDAFERDFGLRVALNVVNPDSLRSVDVRTFEELTLMTRSQTSQASGLENFRVSQAEDILKAVTGTPRDEDFGSRVTGADAAKVTYVPDLLLLGQKCEQLLAAYRSDRYKERFGFIDQLRTERDPARITRLNDAVIHRLRAREFATIHLAPPEVVDLQEIESFVYHGLSQETYQDLVIEQYRELVDDERSITCQVLRKAKIGTIYRGAGEPHFRWSVFDCLVAEVREGNLLYVLSGGTWYQVEIDFAEQVAKSVESKFEGSSFLPIAAIDEDEGNYNSRVARERALHLLDRRTVRPHGARTPIELCDLLTDDRKLVHVKRRSRSSTLSHLFSQGVVSAETFRKDSSFRAELKAKLTHEGLDRAAEYIPEGRPVPEEWEVVYAVIGGQQDGWPRNLPFFSQLNFKIAAEHLAGSGYRVSLVHVPVG